MINWLQSLSLLNTALLLLLVLSYSIVSYRCLSTFGRSSAIGWYRGIQNSPLFALLMWPGYGLVKGAIALGSMGRSFVPIKRSDEKSHHTLGATDYIAGRGKGVYHRTGCEYAELLADDKRIYFRTVDEAERKRFRPCNWCFADQSQRSVHPEGELEKAGPGFSGKSAV